MGDPGGAPPSAPPTTVEIDAQDVVRVVLQWARESGLDATAAALGREARVALNAPPGGRAALLADVRRGRWDAVLPTVATLELPTDGDRPEALPAAPDVQNTSFGRR